MSIVRLARVCALAILLAGVLPSQQAETRDGPEGKTDAIFARWDRPDSPGCAVGVVADGRVAYKRGFGMANLEHGIPNGPATVFDLGSTSKQFTAACVLLLANEGRLGLDDDLRKHVPEIPDYGRPITIRHLMHHTSGVRDYCELLGMRGFDDEDLTTAADALAIIARQRAPNFPAGDEHQYSNSGYFLLAVVVERVSGTSLARFAKERIFDPLGMRDTRFVDDHRAIVPRRATGYRPTGGGSFGTNMSDWEQTGDGAVLSTVDDLILWEANFRTRAVGGDALFDALHRRGMLSDGREISYAGGLMHGRYKALPTVSHGGAWAGYRAEFLRFPEQRFAVICLCNLASMAPSMLARRVAEAWLADAIAAGEAASRAAPASRSASRPRRDVPSPASRPAKPGPTDLAGLAGQYFSAELDATYEISVVDGRLAARGWKSGLLRLVPQGGDVFGAGGATWTFTRDGGRVTGFTMDGGRIQGVRFDRR